MNEFLDFVNKLIEASPVLAEELMTDNIKNYLTVLANEKPKPALTESGKTILSYLQQNIPEGPFKSSDVATGLETSARGISGALRKLVTDGFVTKTGKDPIIYELTEKGRNFIINEE